MTAPRLQQPTAWVIFRVALLAAAVSLGFYIPYKYATQLHAVQGLYAFLFPLSSVLVVLGIALSVRPELAFRIPGPGRAAVAALAAGWIATGMLCVPSLTKQAMSIPVAGLFATFHMLAQHVFLSLSVAALVVVPAAVFAQFGAAAATRERSPARSAIKLEA